MYTEKVMEHFTKPRNVGCMNDADGIGKVGNPVCLLPDEKIHLIDRIKGIQGITKDLVLSHDGEYHSVSNNSRRLFSGKILCLKSKLGKIHLTPDHMVYSMKVPKKDKFKRIKNKVKLMPVWHHAHNLVKGDIILYPIIKKEIDKNFLRISVTKSKYDFRSKNLPSIIPINDAFLRLSGYFLAEGNVQMKPSKTYLSFTLNIKEKDIAKDIANISKTLFNIDVKIQERPDRKTLIVYIYNVFLAHLFKKLFDNYGKNKKLPAFMLFLPLDKQKKIIYGLWKGDGYVNLSRQNPRAGYSTISYELAHQIKLLLLRQKIVPSIYSEEEKVIRGVKHTKCYRIHIGQKESMKRLCSILELHENINKNPAITSWFDSNFLYTPITKKEEFEYSGKVHNLEVAQTHSFTSEAFCVHNCGDVMEIFIKVRNNKIKDIKFRTFGCASAIATSSMVTELAKGKTLEQAELISNKDVADALGSLPPIKMHCSNLAADALKAAIKDYKEKARLKKAADIKVTKMKK